LHAVEGLSIKQIANRLSMQNSGVKTRLSRARHRLSEELTNMLKCGERFQMASAA
jgi:DNA-directed RNA polymerase specialized sigma24 family protein